MGYHDIYMIRSIWRIMRKLGNRTYYTGTAGELDEIILFIHAAHYLKNIRSDDRN